MNPATLQLINTILAALIVAVIIGIARWVQSKADKADLGRLEEALASKADKVELNRVESEGKARSDKFETRVDAAMLVVNQGITRAELTEKLTAASGRAEDNMRRVLADIVQLFTDTKATAKSAADTDKRLDDLPGRVRTLEDKENRKG